MVVALVKNEATRRIVENRIATIGPKFVSSYSIMNGANLGLTKDQKLKILKDENYDAVLAKDYSEHSLMNAGVILLKNSEWLWSRIGCIFFNISTHSSSLK